MSRIFVAFTLFAALAVSPLLSASPAQAGVYVSYYGGYAKHPYYKRGFGYGHNPPYAVKRPYILGYRSYGLYHRGYRHRGYGRAYGYHAPLGIRSFDHGPHRPDRRVRSRTVLVEPAPTIVWNNTSPRNQHASARQYCAPFEEDVLISGTWQTVTGRACQQPDGTWRIVSK